MYSIEYRCLGLKSLTLFFYKTLVARLGKQILGQSTDKKGSNRGLDFGSFTDFLVPKFTI